MFEIRLTIVIACSFVILRYIGILISILKLMLGVSLGSAIAIVRTIFKFHEYYFKCLILSEEALLQYPVDLVNILFSDFRIYIDICISVSRTFITI